jgi:predicted alpha-1,2-mannosidase
MNYRILKNAAFIFLIFSLVSCVSTQEEKDHLVNYVNPFIGTGGHGHTYPGAALPFGMVQLSPDNGTSGWDWCSGYHISDSVIAGFSHLHLSGTGIGDLADISVLPVNKEIVPDTIKNGSVYMRKYWSAFSHQSEQAEPGYYSVFLDDPKVKAEMTTSLRTGFHRYSFEEPGKHAIVFDLGFRINWDHPVETMIQLEENGLITGFRRSKGWAADQIMYFAARFDQPVKSFKGVVNGEAVNGKQAEGKSVQGIFSFPEEGQRVVKLKVGLSSASIEGAKKSLENEIRDWDFDRVKKEASDIWEKQLERVTVETGNLDNKTIFYTALYHSLLAPSLYSDLNDEYTGPDKKVHKTNGDRRYTVFSLWDTFRAAHPLFTLILPEEVPGLINSMLSFYREGGLLPVWELEGNETNTMIGYHSVPVIADAFLKGFTGFDPEEALNAMVKSGMQDTRGLNYYKKLGFIPSRKENESVSKALEYAYDDWCISTMARQMGKTKIADEFTQRAYNYRNHFDPSTRFMRGKYENGEWKVPFDPLYSEHRFDDYTEGNAWQYTWFVPQDVKGLIELMGGREGFVEKLDSLFEIKEAVRGKNSSADISGLIGQYAHGNEPSHHIAYLYNYAGVPWKTQFMVRRILKEMYHNNPNGLSGNEDCGQMSAWYILSSMGFYPVNPAEGVYVIGSPLFDKVSFNPGSGRNFEIIVHNNSDKNVYIQSVKLNNEALNRSFIYHEEILEGGVLEITMGEQPNKELWSAPDASPPSLSDDYSAN